MRLFSQHQIRYLTSLDGLWDFAFSPDGHDRQPSQYNSSMAVPGCWDASIEFALQRGVGCYRRQFRVPEDGRYLLRFDGVANDAAVFVNGEHLCSHYGPHTPFVSPAIRLNAGPHTLEVKADNRFGDHNTLLQEKCGWYCYGGIHRSVYLERLADVRIERLTGRVLAVDETTARVRLSAELRNYSDTFQSRSLSLFFDHLDEAQLEVELEPRQTKEISREFALLDIQPWTPDNPALYTLAAVTQDDDLRERFGVRTIECRERNILINGEPVKLRGVNHHDYQPNSGYTNTLEQIKYDLDLIKQLGLNFVRTSHYPKDQLFLDLCDEMGLMVFEEATGWQNGPEEMRTNRFRDQCSQCIEEMVKTHENHPSIIIWGLLNEVRSEYDDLRPVFEHLINRFHELDPTRPVTYATNRLLFMGTEKQDKMLDLVDILCPNLYNRWYENIVGPENGDPADYLERQLANFDEQGLSDKPVIIGECGAGAQLGCHRIDRRRWSEEMQADIVQEIIEVYGKHPRIAGYAIWLFADTACSENEEMGRPGSHNCKGLVDEYRRPKMAFYKVDELHRRA